MPIMCCATDGMSKAPRGSLNSPHGNDPASLNLVGSLHFLGGRLLGVIRLLGLHIEVVVFIPSCLVALYCGLRFDFFGVGIPLQKSVVPSGQAVEDGRILGK